MSEDLFKLEIVKTVGAALAFVIGLAQYRRGQRWKRAEFVAAEVKEFNAIPEVQNAKLMLDYTERYVDLYPEREKPEDRRVRLTDEQVVQALAPHTERDRFTQDEARIRDTFDTFFDRLERFENFIAAGLISTDECSPYLAYWLEIVGDTGKDARRAGLGGALKVFVCEYDYDGVKRLLHRFGYQVKPRTAHSVDPHPRRKDEG